MKIYLVGGAVRDLVMDVMPKDRDYVVVGSNPTEMKSLGYKQVGADFPVFLHPDTGDEYALARTEKKEYTGYCGFTSAWEGVSLEQDLARRDLTINAMALDLETKEVIDLFGGLEDIKNKTLRHTSGAFIEDPVRVLRLARFKARFGPEWNTDLHTLFICGALAEKEFKYLTPERVWKETERALMEPYATEYFEFIRFVDSGDVLFPELHATQGIPQPVEHHPEGCVWTHTMLALQTACGFGLSAKERFAVLCHDLGKPLSYHTRGTLHGHEGDGVQLVNDLCDRLKVSKEYRNLAVKVCEWHTHSHKALEMTPKRVMKLFERLDAIRKPKILEPFLAACEADARGRRGAARNGYLEATYLTQCLKAALSLDTAPVAKECREKGWTGDKIGGKIREERIKLIRQEKNRWN